MKKQYLIAILITLALLLVSGIFIFTKNESSLDKSINLQKGDLVTKNTSKGDLKFITNQTEKITINLVGPADELKKVVFSQIDTGASEFSLPEDSKGIKGTITVPQGITIINLDLPPGVNLEVNTPDGKKDLGKFPTEDKNIYKPGGGGSENGSHDGGTDISDGGNTGGGGEGEGEGEGESEGEGEGENPYNPPNPPTPPTPPQPPTPPEPPVPPSAFCGNGKLETGERCDDGNKKNGDGCSSLCLIEPSGPFCGNRIINLGETCDDGNKVSGDGCSSSCKIEIPTAICGNKIKEVSEDCDDGNIISGDGCSSSCKMEFTRFEQCTIMIKQEERNLCCQQVQANEPHDDCTGYWLFNYHTRLCEWHCPRQNCSLLPTQAKRDFCCEDQNEDEPTPPCSGDWIFNNASSSCEYQCAEFGEPKDHSEEEVTETSQYCLNTYTDANQINQCCDEFLKHPLSLGSHPGFPDCIGKWSVQPGTHSCQFECSTQEEMIEILKEIKANVQEEE